jgi:hypothetical protein
LIFRHPAKRGLSCPLPSQDTPRATAVIRTAITVVRTAITVIRTAITVIRTAIIVIRTAIIVIPIATTVIPAKAGIQQPHNPKTSLQILPLSGSSNNMHNVIFDTGFLDARLRGHDASVHEQ